MYNENAESLDQKLLRISIWQQQSIKLSVDASKPRNLWECTGCTPRKPAQEPYKTRCRPGSTHESSSCRPCCKGSHSLPISPYDSKHTVARWLGEFGACLRAEEQNTTWLVAYKGNKVSPLSSPNLNAH